MNDIKDERKKLRIPLYLHHTWSDTSDTELFEDWFRLGGEKSTLKTLKQSLTCFKRSIIDMLRL